MKPILTRRLEGVNVIEGSLNFFSCEGLVEKVDVVLIESVGKLFGMLMLKPP